MLDRFLYGVMEGFCYMFMVLVIIVCAALMAIPFVLWIMGVVCAWWLFSYIIIIPIVCGIHNTFF
jgi:hypothetical protein